MAEERVVLRRRHSVQVKALVLEPCAVPRPPALDVSTCSHVSIISTFALRKRPRINSFARSERHALTRRCSDALNLLTFLSNQLNCAIVVLVTRDALAAMQTDAQIASRFPGFEQPRWPENEDFWGFLAGFERLLPLRQASRISGSRAMVNAIMSATSGITGRVSELLSCAAEAAIRTKKECLTPKLVQYVIGTRSFA